LHKQALRALYFSYCSQHKRLVIQNNKFITSDLLLLLGGLLTANCYFYFVPLTLDAVVIVLLFLLFVASCLSCLKQKLCQLLFSLNFNNLQKLTEWLLPCVSTKVLPLECQSNKKVTEVTNCKVRAYAKPGVS